MYSFTPLDGEPSRDEYPAESLLLFTGDGSRRHIEDLVPGFKTLNVSGRNGAEREPLGEEMDTRSGAIMYGTRTGPREIVVTYQLLSDKAAEQYERYSKLRSIFFTYLDFSFLKSDGLFEIAFSDKPEVRYFSSLPSFEDPEPGRLDVTGEITFYCPDPHAYSMEKEGKAGEKVQKDGSLPWKAMAKVFTIKGSTSSGDTIKITGSNGVTTLTKKRSIDNLGNSFSDEEGAMTGSYQNGGNLEMDCVHGEIKVSGVSSLEDLTLSSTFPDVYIENGEALSMSGASGGSFTYRWQEIIE